MQPCCVICRATAIFGTTMKPGPTEISSLSDDLLRRIFATSALQDDRFQLPLVCKRWNTVFCSFPELWDSIVLGQQDSISSAAACRDALASFLCWVQPRREHIRNVTVGSWGGAAPLVAAVHLTRLQTLIYRVYQEESSLQDLFSLLVIMPELQHLEVLVWDGIISQKVSISPMAHLAELRDLELDFGVHLVGGAVSLAACSNLTRLQTDATKWETFQPLSSLQNLADLSLRAKGTGPPSLGSCLQALSNLTRLDLQGLASTTELSLSGRAHSKLARLVLCNMRGLTSFTAAVPTGLSALSHLEVRYRDLPGAQQATSFFSSLPNSPAPAFLALKSLLLHNLELPIFPENINALQGLTQLSISHPPKAAEQYASIPCSLTKLSSLQKLTLSNVARLTLNLEVIMGLRSLTKLTINYCKCLRVSRSIFKLIQQHPSLDEIDLHGSTIHNCRC